MLSAGWAARSGHTLPPLPMVHGVVNPSRELAHKPRSMGRMPPLGLAQFLQQERPHQAL
jgi:hypothetical protein